MISIQKSLKTHKSSGKVSVSSDNVSFQWYALNVIAGREMLVKSNIMKLLSGTKYEKDIDEIQIPMVVNAKYINGKKINKISVMCNGYIYVKANLCVELVQMIERMSNVIKFPRTKNLPIPISENDMKIMLSSR